jgi:hypothetical protein
VLLALVQGQCVSEVAEIPLVHSFIGPRFEGIVQSQRREPDGFTRDSYREETSPIESPPPNGLVRRVKNIGTSKSHNNEKSSPYSKLLGAADAVIRS